jgi:hypothetical protein
MFSTMSISQATATSYSGLAITTELLVLEPELQRLVDELDHLGISFDPLCGVPEQDTECNLFAFAADDETYLSVYDLCGGDSALVDSIEWANLGPSIVSSTTPSLVAATPSPKSDYFAFPPPSIGGKWAPTSHHSAVSSSLYGYAPPAPAAQVSAPTPHPATPSLARSSNNAGPSRAIRATNNVRHQPYRKAVPITNKAKRSVKGKRRLETTKDYLDAYPATPENITPLPGYRGFIREGRWTPIMVDALRQIGVPYPMKGLQKLLSELYDGEGEQEGVPRGAEGRRTYPWRVSLESF